MPFETRVDCAMARLLAKQDWSAPQRRWLERIARTLREKVVVDEATFSQGAYATDGGFRAIDNVFGGRGRACCRNLKTPFGAMPPETAPRTTHPDFEDL